MMAYLSSFGRQTTEVTTTKRYFLYTLQSGLCIVTSYNEYVGEEEEKEMERTKKVKTGLQRHVVRMRLVVHLPPKFFHVIPLLGHSLPKLMYSFRWNLIFLKFAFDIVPEMFDRIEVRGLSRPVNNNNVVIQKPSCGQFGGVF